MRGAACVVQALAGRRCSAGMARCQVQRRGEDWRCRGRSWVLSLTWPVEDPS